MSESLNQWTIYRNIGTAAMLPVYAKIFEEFEKLNGNGKNGLQYAAAFPIQSNSSPNPGSTLDQLSSIFRMEEDTTTGDDGSIS